MQTLVWVGKFLVRYKIVGDIFFYPIKEYENICNLRKNEQWSDNVFESKKKAFFRKVTFKYGLLLTPVFLFFITIFVRNLVNTYSFLLFLGSFYPFVVQIILSYLISVLYLKTIVPFIIPAFAFTKKGIEITNDLGGKIKDGVNNSAKRSFGVIRKAGSSAIDFVKNAGSYAASGLKTGASKTYDAMSSAKNSIVSRTKAIGQITANTSKTVASKGVDIAKVSSGTIADGAKTAAIKVRDGVKSSGRGMKKLFGKMSTGIKKLIGIERNKKQGS